MFSVQIVASENVSTLRSAIYKQLASADKINTALKKITDDMSKQLLRVYEETPQSKTFRTTMETFGDLGNSLRPDSFDITVTDNTASITWMPNPEDMSLNASPAMHTSGIWNKVFLLDHGNQHGLDVAKMEAESTPASNNAGYVNEEVKRRIKKEGFRSTMGSGMSSWRGGMEGTEGGRKWFTEQNYTEEEGWFNQGAISKKFGTSTDKPVRMSLDRETGRMAPLSPSRGISRTENVTVPHGDQTARAIDTGDYERGAFRTAIFEWAEKSGIPKSAWSAIANRIAEGGTQPANPPLMKGNLWEDDSYQVPTNRLSAILNRHLADLLERIVEGVIQEFAKRASGKSYAQYRDVATGRYTSKPS